MYLEIDRTKHIAVMNLSSHGVLFSPQPFHPFVHVMDTVRVRALFDFVMGSPFVDMRMDFMDIRNHIAYQLPTRMTKMMDFARWCHEANIFTEKIPFGCPAAAMPCAVRMKMTYIEFCKTLQDIKTFFRSRDTYDKLHFVNMNSPWDFQWCITRSTHCQRQIIDPIFRNIDVGNSLLEFFIRNTVCAFFTLQSIRIRCVCDENRNYFLSAMIKENARVKTINLRLCLGPMNVNDTMENIRGTGHAHCVLRIPVLSGVWAYEKESK